jgi:anti-sigma factor ChrR (cupin superfamily)
MATQESVQSQLISVGDRPWQEMQPGVRMKPLWTDEKTNRRAVLARIEPGVPPSLHRHVGDELVFVLEGALADEFGTVTAGNVGYRPNGCVHGVSSPQGATVLAVVTGGVEPAKERGNAPSSQIFTLNEVAWVEAMAGVRVKPVWEDKATARRAILARFEPGATLPRHRHVGDELIFVVEGASVDESGTVTPGNLNYRPNGCVHTVSTQNGATVFAVVWGHVEPVS